MQDFKINVNVVNANAPNLVNIKIVLEIVNKNVNIMLVILHPMSIYVMQNIYAIKNVG
jgi:hypothetical protein